MARQELIDYVEQNLKRGFTKEQVVAALRRAGYAEESIAEVFPKSKAHKHVLMTVVIIAVLAIIISSAVLVTQLTGNLIEKQPLLEQPKTEIKPPSVNYVKDDEVCSALVRFEILNLGGKIRFCSLDDRPPKVQFMAHNFGKVPIKELVLTANGWYTYSLPDTAISQDDFIARMITLDRQVKEVTKAKISPVVEVDGREIICDGITIDPVEMCG